VIGALLIFVGASRFKGKHDTMDSCLYPGTGVHVTLALLATISALPLIGLIVSIFGEVANGVRYTINVNGTLYLVDWMLELALLVSFVALGPYVVLYIDQGIKRRRLFAILDAEESKTLPHEGAKPLAHVRPAPLRDVSGAPGSFVDLGEGELRQP
jgi:hypothetical protein